MTMTSDAQLALVAATLKMLVPNCSPDALEIAILGAAREVGVPWEEAKALLEPLQRTQRESTMHRMFWRAS